MPILDNSCKRESKNLFFVPSFSCLHRQDLSEGGKPNIAKQYCLETGRATFDLRSQFNNPV